MKLPLHLFKGWDLVEKLASMNQLLIFICIAVAFYFVFKNQGEFVVMLAAHENEFSHPPAEQAINKNSLAVERFAEELSKSTLESQRQFVSITTQQAIDRKNNEINLLETRKDVLQVQRKQIDLEMARIVNNGNTVPALYGETKNQIEVEISAIDSRISQIRDNAAEWERLSIAPR